MLPVNETLARELAEKIIREITVYRFHDIGIGCEPAWKFDPESAPNVDPSHGDMIRKIRKLEIKVGHCSTLLKG